MKIYVCDDCHFKMKEKNKICPICHGKTKKVDGDIKKTFRMPEKLTKTHKDVALEYICPKCQRHLEQAICPMCNVQGLLLLQYNNKKVIINKVYDLYTVFTDEEVKEIANLLSEDEKNILYHNFYNSYLFFYHQDKGKAIGLFIMGIIIEYIVLNLMTEWYEDSIELVYFTSGFGIGLLTTFVAIGINYLVDARVVEESKLAGKLGLANAIIVIIYVALSFYFTFAMKEILIGGAIAILVCAIVDVFVSIAKGSKE